MANPRNNPIDISDFCIRRVLRELLDGIGYEDVEMTKSMTEGLEPESTYLSFDIPSLKEIGRSETTSYLLEDRKTYTKKSYQAFLQISSIGKGSGGLMSTISSRVPESDKLRAIFRKWGFSILNKTELRRNPQKRESEWVDTYNIGLNITFSYYFREDSDWFELVTIDGYEFSIADN